MIITIIQGTHTVLRHLLSWYYNKTGWQKILWVVIWAPIIDTFFWWNAKFSPMKCKFIKTRWIYFVPSSKNNHLRRGIYMQNLSINLDSQNFRTGGDCRGKVLQFPVFRKIKQKPKDMKALPKSHQLMVRRSQMLQFFHHNTFIPEESRQTYKHTAMWTQERTYGASSS